MDNLFDKVFESEKIWIEWKNQGCPQFEGPKSNSKDVDVALKKKELREESLQDREAFFKQYINFQNSNLEKQLKKFSRNLLESLEHPTFGYYFGDLVERLAQYDRNLKEEVEMLQLEEMYYWRNNRARFFNCAE